MPEMALFNSQRRRTLREGMSSTATLWYTLQYTKRQSEVKYLSKLSFIGKRVTEAVVLVESPKS